MTRDQAYAIAINAIQHGDVDTLRCFSEAVECNYSLPNEPAITIAYPDGTRDRVWVFAFAPINDDPNCVISGGGCIVYVDDQTEGVAIFQSL